MQTDRCCAVLLLLLTVAPSPAAEGPTGEQIYRQQCAWCHGANGQGHPKRYPNPLVGTKSVDQLTELIDKTMPEDDPSKCVGEDARKVAVYVYDAFYSPAAQARNAPPRIELSRLTVRQYQNAVADLIGSFRATPKPDDRRGLRGEYFNARGFRGDKRVIDRTDPELRFDFGRTGPEPEPEKFDAHQFSVRWEGSVLAPETGDYEFVVRTEHAARLWVNQATQPLIDAWVKSGNDTEYRASVFLLGGRSYPVRLEFSKAKQGVDDKKKNTKERPPVKASVALLWRPPHRVDEVIPERNLSLAKPPETFVVNTDFPPDDRSLGWERATAVSKEWDAATTDAALEVAGYVAARWGELAGVRDGDAGKAKQFCHQFAERAFRRPLTDEEKQTFVERQFEAGRPTDVAVKRVVILVLKSPRFLYHEAAGSPAAHGVASRLAFALWDAPPDRELLEAAAAGRLAKREEVVRQAERMLNDPRARAKLREFLLRWLKVEQIAEVAKDPKRFPGFDAATVADLRTSLELFLEDVIWGKDSDFRRLLTDDQVFLNGRLAKFYGAKLPDDAPFQKVALDAEKRAGVLTHPYLMSAFAYTGSSSPIHRGVFLARGVLGVSLRPPQDAFTPLPEDLHPTLTTRERIQLQTKPQACASCHGVINPLGFALESFDAVGRFRDRDNGKPVDATGSYQTRNGETVKFDGARELAKYLTVSDEVHGAFTEQLFHHLVKQPVRAYGVETPVNLRRAFAENSFSVRKLAAEIATTAALKARE
jgi:cytochrome c553